MLQHMPAASPFARQAASGFDGLLAAEDMLDGADAENWNRAVMLLGTVEETELIGPQVGADELLLRLFHQEEPRVFDPQAVRFGCTCSRQKVVSSLSAYPPEEIAAMTTPDGTVTADCQFCGAHYELDPAELDDESGRPDA
jgi:molecular chaperone Hsp33